MKYLFFIFSIGLLSPLSAAPEARLTNVTGKVYLRPAHMPANQWIEAEVDTPLDEGDTVLTGTGSSAEVTLDGDTVVLLNEKTEFKADTLQESVTRFFLALGSLTAKIRQLRDSQKQFSIKTPVAVAAVRGTELAISYEGEEAPAVIGVFDEGQVAVQSEGQEDVLVNPGEETEVSPGARALAPRPLAKLLVNRPNIAHVRERVQYLKPRWQSVPPLKRKEFRARLLAKHKTQFKRPAPPAPRRRLRREPPR